MRKLFIIPLLLFSLTVMPACSHDDDSAATETELPTTPGASGDEDNTDGTGDTDEPNDPDTPDSPNTPDEPDNPDTPDNPGVKGKTLVAYFSAQGHTQAVAERIAKLTGAEVYRIEAAEPSAANPYDDSDRIQNEAYNDLRPGVANLPDAETIAQYDTIFVGSPCWWHQPAMVVCTFLEAYDLKGKVIVPFITYGATTYLNETMQKIYRLTPGSRHIPETLPEDLNPDDITTPGPADDAGIDMPGNARGTEAWLRRIGVIR